MQDILSRVAMLKRPKLLVRAALFGLDDYQRGKHLPRALQSEDVCSSGPALIRLMEIERDQNDQRKADSGAYHAGQHIDVLIAIMGEARMLRAMTANVVPFP